MKGAMINSNPRSGILDTVSLNNNKKRVQAVYYSLEDILILLSLIHSHFIQLHHNLLYITDDLNVQNLDYMDKNIN